MIVSARGDNLSKRKRSFLVPAYSKYGKICSTSAANTLLYLILRYNLRFFVSMVGIMLLLTKMVVFTFGLIF